MAFFATALADAVRHRTVVLLLAAAAVALAGCTGDSTAPQKNSEIAVFGTLYVGEAVSDTNAIFVTRVRPVDEYYDRDEAAVNDALVTIRRDGADSPDTLMLVRPGRYADSTLFIEPRTTYHLRVATPDGRVLTAMTTTPYPFQVEAGPPTVPSSQVPHSVLQDSFPVLVRCENPDQVFVVDAYCLETWETARYVNPFGSHNAPDNDDEYGNENGEPRHIFAYFRIGQVVTENDAYVIDFYSAMIAFFGLFDVQVLSVDDNTYNYLYRDHPEEHGGIVGGIGLFGSAQRRVWRIHVIE
jgi:hypothetical protein